MSDGKYALIHSQAFLDAEIDRAVKAERKRLREQVEKMTVLIQQDFITEESSVRYVKVADVLALLDGREGEK